MLALQSAFYGARGAQERVSHKRKRTYPGDSTVAEILLKKIVLETSQREKSAEIL